METQTEILECGHEPALADQGRPWVGTGYGTDDAGKRYCYACCAERDREQMRTDGRATLYLTLDQMRGPAPAQPVYSVSNWPGSLRIPVRQWRKSRHNFGCERTDVWFAFEGRVWHGVNIGDNQILRCRRTLRPVEG